MAWVTECVEQLFENSLSAFVCSAFRSYPFRAPFLKKIPQVKSLTLRVGQPLFGLLLLFSWPLFTLTHHLLVMYCAEQVHPGQKFYKYAILGDDVVICGIEVAKIFKQTLAELGVDISMSKSLISHSGSAEFAKRFWCKGLTVDLSPVSIRNLLNSHHLPGALSLLVIKKRGFALSVGFMVLDLE